MICFQQLFDFDVFSNGNISQKIDSFIFCSCCEGVLYIFYLRMVGSYAIPYLRYILANENIYSNLEQYRINGNTIIFFSDIAR